MRHLEKIAFGIGDLADIGPTANPQEDILDQIFGFDRRKPPCEISPELREVGPDPVEKVVDPIRGAIVPIARQGLVVAADGLVRTKCHRPPCCIRCGK
ncbi:MAG: hypothetical protein WC804_05470 [Sphingomonas sp.]|uniref:hypothetical protein n=1 Tax=Sphingomonas sp. TaxID=28214 RepID=UPI003567C4C2